MVLRQNGGIRITKKETTRKGRRKTGRDALIHVYTIYKGEWLLVQCRLAIAGRHMRKGT